MINEVCVKDRSTRWDPWLTCNLPFLSDMSKQGYTLMCRNEETIKVDLNCM